MSLFSSVAQLCPTLCDPVDCTMPGFPVHHQLQDYSNSCPSSWWCHPTISSSVVPFSSCLQSFPASGSFPVNQFFISDGQKYWSFSISIGPPVNIQDWFLLELSGLISLLSKGLSRVFSNTTFKSINSSVLSFLYGPTLTFIHNYWKTIALTRLIFVDKIMSLLFSMLSRLVIAFFPRGKCLTFMTAVTICSDFGAKENKVCHCLPTYLPWSDGTRRHDLKVFWMLSFKPAFSLSSFSFIKRLFSSSFFSSIRVMSLAYLKLLIFLLAILIPACASPSLAFLMIYSAFKLTKQGDYISLDILLSQFGTSLLSHVRF